MDSNPIQQFAEWFDEAKECGKIALPEAMCLSTVDLQGYPDSRMVLLKSFDQKGFIFYTNFESPKAQALDKLPQAALNFYWDILKKQVCIQGKTEKVSDAEADAYFKTRPRLSQIAAWASKQSAPLDSRETLEKKFNDLCEEYRGKEIPRPPFWGGFCLLPSEIEFWEERPNRLHDRFLYVRAGDNWEMKRLYP